MPDYPERWSKIIPALEEFQSYLSPKAPTLRIVLGNDKQWSKYEYDTQVQQGVFRQCGVYLFTTTENVLEYIGLATRTFDDRIWKHDDHISRRYTDLIPIPRDFDFLAPALEMFLIQRLNPPENKALRKQDG